MSEGREAAVGKLVHEAEREWKLGPDDGQIDLHRFGEVRQLDDVLDADREARRLRGHARVPRRREDVRDARRLRELPYERVLATPGADDEDPHLVRERVYPTGA